MHHALCEFELDTRRTDMTGGDCLNYLIDKIRLLELSGTDVNRNLNVFHGRLGLPVLDVPASFADHPQPDWQNQSGFLGNTNKILGSDQTARRMSPA